MVPVVILAGGGGTRMGEVGKMIPKFLLPVNGEILLMRTYYITCILFQVITKEGYVIGSSRQLK